MHNWEKLRDGQIDWSVFKTRIQILDLTRQFFQDQGFLEIEAPMLTPFPTLDSNIYSIESGLESESGTRTPMYLHTSPEHSMKKLLAAGAEKIFYLGKVFRNREQTCLHNPEFTMCEWYRTHVDYHQIMEDTESLICYLANNLWKAHKGIYQNQPVDLTPGWDRKSVHSLFMDKTGIDLNLTKDTAAFQETAREKSFNINDADSWEDIFFKIFLDKIERDLGFPKPVFVTDYPARMGLMAKRHKDNPDWVERTELYIAGLELANGYSELTDPEEQRQRFLEEQREKQKAGYNYPIDEELIEALKSGLPPSSGMALGMDRLIMLLLDKTNIEDVLLFPVSQWH